MRALGLLALAVIVLVTGCSSTPVVAEPAVHEVGNGGFVKINGQAVQWLMRNPGDPRAPAIKAGIADHPVAQWLAGDEAADERNLRDSKDLANSRDATALLVLYNIPGRNDGLSPPTGLADEQYRQWVDRRADELGNTRAIVVIEPDALWFADRQFPDPAARSTRLAQVRYAAERFARSDAVRVYIDAGTSSGSVTPQRMAELLVAAGASDRIGFAVNTSSFAPAPAISAYASAIRTHMIARGVASPHYVVDTSRNGNPQWDYQWCNPDGRRVGALPGVVGAPDGHDYNLWIKEPGTSDGDCGNGAGSVGGQFLPDVAMQQLGK